MSTDKKARALAKERAERAARYAKRFPHLIKESDKKYQDVEWQYHRLECTVCAKAGQPFDES